MEIELWGIIWTAGVIRSKKTKYMLGMKGWKSNALEKGKSIFEADSQGWNGAAALKGEEEEQNERDEDEEKR